MIQICMFKGHIISSICLVSVRKYTKSSFLLYILHFSIIVLLCVLSMLALSVQYSTHSVKRVLCI